MGKSREYRSRELGEAIDRCIAHCMETGEAPVAFVLHKFTDVPEEKLEAYVERGEAVNRGEAHGGSEIMGRYRAAKRWEEFRTFFWLERERKDGKTASFARFNLMQSENGGYKEKEEKPGKPDKVQFTVKVDGLGGVEALK